MKFLLTATLFFSLATVVNAKEMNESEMRDVVDYYLIIGSFRSKNRADKALAMFARRSVDKLAIQKAEAFGEAWHRVAHGPYDTVSNSLKDEFVAIGVHDAWWLQKIRTMTVTLVVTEEPTTPRAVEEKQITRPRAGDSYISYCVQKANAPERAIYCSDSDFNTLGELEKNSATLAEVQQGLGDSPEELRALAGFCLLKATASQRATHCSQ